MARTAARNFLALFFDEVGGWKGGEEQNLSAKIEISVRVRGAGRFGPGDRGCSRSVRSSWCRTQRERGRALFRAVFPEHLSLVFLSYEF
jgi:hypothetical protein